MSSTREATTVLLDRRSENRTLRPFYCVKCGKCVCEVYGDVSIIVPGSADAIELPNIGSAINCPGYVRLQNGTNMKCNAKYIF